MLDILGALVVASGHPVKIRSYYYNYYYYYIHKFPSKYAKKGFQFDSISATLAAQYIEPAFAQITTSDWYANHLMHDMI